MAINALPIANDKTPMPLQNQEAKKLYGY